MNLLTRIIIAEDDEDDVYMFKCAMKEVCPDLKLTIATDGETLLCLLNAGPPLNVLFLDINMPRKNGKECLKEIRNNRKFDDLIIIMFSTSDDENDRKYCIDNGADHYIAKPPTYDRLIVIVEDLCSGKFTQKSGSVYPLFQEYRN